MISIICFIVYLRYVEAEDLRQAGASGHHSWTRFANHGISEIFIDRESLSDYNHYHLDIL